MVRLVEAIPLAHEPFAPFGEVVAHAGVAPRHYLRVPFQRDPNASRPEFWVTRAAESRRLPLRVTTLERHRFSAQTFIPLRVRRYLVVVAPNAADGFPDLSELRAFVANGGQGVSYRPGTWHQGLTVLDDAGEFAVMMSMTGNGDDEFWGVPTPID
ncbi:MAG: ureidoglycolate lyase, partial [Roseiarcus sp.]